MKDCIDIIYDSAQKIDIKASCDNYLSRWWNIKQSRVVDGVYYAALKETTRPYRTIGAIYQLRIEPDFIVGEFSTEYEPQYPENSKCPLDIIGLLSNTRSKCALQWRKVCIDV